MEEQAQFLAPLCVCVCVCVCVSLSNSLLELVPQRATARLPDFSLAHLKPLSGSLLASGSPSKHRPLSSSRLPANGSEPSHGTVVVRIRLRVTAAHKRAYAPPNASLQVVVCAGLLLKARSVAPPCRFRCVVLDPYLLPAALQENSSRSLAPPGCPAERARGGHGGTVSPLSW